MPDQKKNTCFLLLRFDPGFAACEAGALPQSYATALTQSL